MTCPKIRPLDPSSADPRMRRQRMGRALATLGIVGLGLFAGCDRSKETVNVQPDAPASPTTQGSTTGPSTGPASTQPVVLIPAKAVNFFITMDDHLVKFPPVRLLIREDDNGMIAQLTSIDLPDEDPDTANSLFISMRLSESSLSNIGKANWHYRAADESEQEPARGFFLAGGRRILQPYDVELDFDRQNNEVHFKLAGRFLSFDNSPDAPEDQPPKVVPVAAQGTVQVEALQ